MSLIAHKTLIETRLKSFVTTFNETEDENFQIKYPLVELKGKNTPVVAVFMTDGLSFQANMGSRYFERTPGMIEFEVTYPTARSKGSNKVDRFCEALKKLFQVTERRLDDGAAVTHDVGRWDFLGEKEDKAHYRVMIPYTRNEPSDAVRVL